MVKLHNTDSLQKILREHEDCHRPLYDKSMGRKLKRRFLLLVQQAIIDQRTFLPLLDSEITSYRNVVPKILSIDLALEYFGKFFYDQVVIEYRLFKGISGIQNEELVQATNEYNLQRLRKYLKAEKSNLLDKMFLFADDFMAIGIPEMSKGLQPILISYYEKRSPHLWNVNILIQELMTYIFSKSVVTESIEDYEVMLTSSKLEEIMDMWEKVFILDFIYDYLHYLQMWLYQGKAEFRYEKNFRSAVQACNTVIRESKSEGLILSKAYVNHLCALKARDSKGNAFSIDAISKAYDRYYEKNT